MMVVVYILIGFVLGVLVMLIYGALATSARADEMAEEYWAKRSDETTHTVDSYLVKDGKIENWDDWSPGEVQ